MADPDQRNIFALFMAAALSISSLPVMAKILGEMNLLRRDFGQLTLAAGMVNDVVGWVMLGAVAGLAQAGEVEIGALASTIAGVAVFFVLAFTVGQFVLDRLLREVRKARQRPGRRPERGPRGRARASASSPSGSASRPCSARSSAGILLGRSKFAEREDAPLPRGRDQQLLRPGLLRHRRAAASTSASSPTGPSPRGRWSSSSWPAWRSSAGRTSAPGWPGCNARESSALSIGLNARGALEIVIATIGLSLGVLNDESYTAVVVMAIATSVVAPPLLRLVLKGWEGSGPGAGPPRAGGDPAHQQRRPPEPHPGSQPRQLELDHGGPARRSGVAGGRRRHRAHRSTDDETELRPVVDSFGQRAGRGPTGRHGRHRPGRRRRGQARLRRHRHRRTLPGPRPPPVAAGRRAARPTTRSRSSWCARAATSKASCRGPTPGRSCPSPARTVPGPPRRSPATSARASAPRSC